MFFKKTKSKNYEKVISDLMEYRRFLLENIVNETNEKGSKHYVQAKKGIENTIANLIGVMHNFGLDWSFIYKYLDKNIMLDVEYMVKGLEASMELLAEGESVEKE